MSGSDTDSDLGPPGMLLVAEDSSGSGSDLGPPGIPGHLLEDGGAEIAQAAIVGRELAPAPGHGEHGQRSEPWQLHQWCRPAEGLEASIAACWAPGATSTRQSRPVELIRQAVQKVCGPAVRKSASLAAEAQEMGVSERSWGRSLSELSSAIYHSSRLLCAGWLGSLGALIASGLAPVLAITRISYDETPIWLRASTDGSCGAHPVVVKVLQTDACCSFLFQNRSTGERLIGQIPLPSILQAGDHCTGEFIIHGIKQTFDIASLQRLLDMFPRICHLSCADLAAPNNKAEEHLSRTRRACESRLRTFCAVHRTFSCQTLGYGVSKQLISGMVNFALSMRPCGATEALREAVRLFFRCRLRRYQGALAPQPDSEAALHREAVIQLYLGPDEGNAGVSRACVLRALLNGDWRREECVEHYCNTCCADEAQTLERLCTLAVDALIPGMCPLFPRSRWTRANNATNYIGLLSNAHGLLHQVVPPWLRSLSSVASPVTARDFDRDMEADSDEDLGPRGMQQIQSVGDAAPLAPFAADDPAHSGDAEGPGEQAGGEGQPDVGRAIDWHEFNERARTQAHEFAKTPSLRGRLAVLSLCMQPAQRLLHRFLKVGSQQCHIEQYSAALDGRPTTMKMLDLASGRVTAPFAEAIVDRLFDPYAWEAVPLAERSAALSCIAFQTLSVLASAAVGFLDHPCTQCFPYKLFVGVFEGNEDALCSFLHAPDCVLDPFALDFRRRFPTREALLGEEARAELGTIGVLIKTDTADIETRHATLRRVHLRAIQTWRKSLTQCSGDYFLLRHRHWRTGGLLREARAAPRGRKPKSRRKHEPSTSARAVRRRERLVARGIVGQKATSSSWKVFFARERAGKHVMPTRAEILDIRRKYRGLSDAEMRELKAEARLRSVRLRARLDPGGADIVRAHHARIRAACAEPDVRGEALALVQAHRVAADSLPETLVELRKRLRAATAMEQLQQEVKRRRLSEEVAAIPAPLEVRRMLAIVPPPVQSSASILPAVNHTFKTIEFYPFAADLAQQVLERGHPTLREALVRKWSEMHIVAKHADLPRVPRLPPQKQCQLLGTCVCRGLGWNQLAFAKAVSRTLAKHCPNKTPLRGALKRGAVVCKLEQEQEGMALWYHISWTNLKTGFSMVLPLRPSMDPLHAARAAPHEALCCQRGDLWRSLFKEAGNLDITAHWSLQLHWLVQDSSASMRRLHPWQVHVSRDAFARDSFWAGPPPPPQDRRRNLREPGEGADRGRPAPAGAGAHHEREGTRDDEAGDQTPLGDAGEQSSEDSDSVPDVGPTSGFDVQPARQEWEVCVALGASQYQSRTRPAPHPARRNIRGSGHVQSHRDSWRRHVVPNVRQPMLIDMLLFSWPPCSHLRDGRLSSGIFT